MTSDARRSEVQKIQQVLVESMTRQRVARACRVTFWLSLCYVVAVGLCLVWQHVVKRTELSRRSRAYGKLDWSTKAICS